MIASEYLPVPDVDAPAPTPMPVAIPLGGLARHRITDPDELLKCRYLCRGGILLLCGPSGIGKSALSMQAQILWAKGRKAYGIEPARPLKSLLIQAENDNGDIAEMRDGVIAGLELTPSEAKQACENVLIVREDTRTGQRLCVEVLRPLLEAHKPDLLWLDPALAYLGGDNNSQQDVGGFLRNGIIPLLREFNCAAVIIHHTNKPPSGKEKPNWTAGDFAYLGAGSAEWANTPRAVLALRSIGSREIFELQAGKRGGRLGWTNPDGTKSFARYLSHSKEPGVICWCEADPEDIAPAGRPKSFDVEEMLGLLPPEGLSAGEWQKVAKGELGISEASFHRDRRALQKDGRILRSKVSGKWQPVRKA
ncbi:MAG TPA: AAA family ATPase [Clostridia bacterium]|nr:AAA family ATPase [Clostridia bacterium]